MTKRESIEIIERLCPTDSWHAKHWRELPAKLLSIIAEAMQGRPVVVTHTLLKVAKLIRDMKKPYNKYGPENEKANRSTEKLFSRGYAQKTEVGPMVDYTLTDAGEKWLKTAKVGDTF